MAEADVEVLLDQLPIETSLASFAGWDFTMTPPTKAVISFKGEVPGDMVDLVNESPWAGSIELRGGAEHSLADLQNFVAEALDVLGAVDGAVWYEAEERRLMVNIVMDPARWNFPDEGLSEAMNAEIVAAGGRPLTDREITIEQFGPENIPDEPRGPNDP